MLGQPAGAVRVSGSDGLAQVLASLLANLVSARASAEVELTNLSDELLTKYEEINMLYDIGAALNPLLDEGAIGRIALDRAIQVIGAEREAVLVTGQQAGTVTLPLNRPGPAASRRISESANQPF